MLSNNTYFAKSHSILLSFFKTTVFLSSILIVTNNTGGRQELNGDYYLSKCTSDHHYFISAGDKLTDFMLARLSGLDDAVYTTVISQGQSNRGVISGYKLLQQIPFLIL
jgi:hypothetical protein